MTGGKVLLSEGLFGIAATVEVKHHLTLRGQGQRATILKLANAADVDMISGPAGSTAARVTIEDLDLDGNRANQSSDLLAGISLDRMTDFALIRRVEIVSIKGRGVEYDGSVASTEGFVLEDVNVWWTTRENIKIANGPGHIIMERCYLGGDILANQVIGLLCQGTASIWFLNSTVDGGVTYPGNCSACVSIQGGQSKIIVGNCNLFGADNGLEIVLAAAGTISDIWVANTYISGTGDYGIRIQLANAGAILERLFMDKVVTLNAFPDATPYSIRYPGTTAGAIFRDSRFRDCDFSNEAVLHDAGPTETNVKFGDVTGYVMENSGTSTGTGGEQTIAHGLAETPTRVYLSDIEQGANAYQSSPADVTNIYITAVNNQDYVWKAEVV